MHKTLTATTLARLAGVHRNTISNYSKSGILSPIVLSDGTRAYGPEDLDHMREIATTMGRGRKRKPAAESGSG
jgi:DNA-binding transcriptional MerR regulator